ncbi:MAG: DUF2220 family protein [Verrucomicrobiales bacterium]
MKSPSELAHKLKRQWDSPTTREERLLCGESSANVWPVCVSIGRPRPGLVASDLDALKRHVEQWRNVRVGEVVWQSIAYRATAGPIEIPVQWKLRRPTEWIEAVDDRVIRTEFEAMATFAEQTDPLFHSLFVRKRSLWREKPIAEVLQAARLAMELEPGCANGRPLRTLSLAGIDTKFFERNARLVTSLLDVRFDGEVSRMGLEPFLGAFAEGDHWLLVVDLDGGLLSFQKQRVRGSELVVTPLPAARILIVENESCLHQLPALADTIAVLGAGFDLSWTAAPWLKEKRVGYWGDIDTWGLQFLARARSFVPHLQALMMTSDVFALHAGSAVNEPVIAGIDPPVELTDAERSLYAGLVQDPRGRLEQEFLPMDCVHAAISEWARMPCR